MSPLKTLQGLVAMVALLAGCAETRELTEVIIVADTDMSIPDEIDSVHFHVDSSAIPIW